MIPIVRVRMCGEKKRQRIFCLSRPLTTSKHFDYAKKCLIIVIPVRSNAHELLFNRKWICLSR